MVLVGLGICDEYLAQQDELGDVLDTPAKVHYQAAVASQQPAPHRHKPRMHNVATETAPLPTDAATSMTTDAGVNKNKTTCTC